MRERSRPPACWLPGTAGAYGRGGASVSESLRTPPPPRTAKSAAKRAPAGGPAPLGSEVEHVRPEVEEGGHRQPDDVQVVAVDALHERRAAPLDGVAAGASLP